MKKHLRHDEHYRPGRFVHPRARLLQKLLFIAFALVAVKTVVLAIYSNRRSTLDNMADRQYHEALDLAPWRGTIYDRRKFPLALSVRRPSLAVNPRIFAPNAQQRRVLARHLHHTPDSIAKIAARRSYFAWLQRKVPPATAEKILALGIAGLYQLTEPYRYYPLGQKFAQLIGYVGIDNTGLLGLEQQFETQLHGKRTALTLIKDARNQPVFFSPTQATPAQSGATLHLTLDRVIQEISMEELQLGIERAQAKKGFVIVADPHSGRLLAIANYPSFDPNKPRHLDTRYLHNTAVSTLFEPGSIVKPLVIAVALDHHLTAAGDLHYCENGRLEVGNTAIRDDHPHAALTTEDILTYSSNICTYKVAQLLGAERLYQLYRDFGIGTAINSLALPGQAQGRIDHFSKWSAIRFANISFGQGFAASGVELINAFNTIANGGKLMQPQLLERIEDSEGKVITAITPQMIARVLQPETARQLRVALGRVVAHGTGKLAALPHYQVGGKTSTAEVFDRQLKRYSKTRRIAGFIGFAPLADPHITIYVSLFEPQNTPRYGGKWAAPVFARIAARVLRYMNVKQEMAQVH